MAAFFWRNFVPGHVGEKANSSQCGKMLITRVIINKDEPVCNKQLYSENKHRLIGYFFY
jgi:hypothetical protein